MSRRATTLAVAALVVALAAALWWLDFRAAHSESTANSTTTTVGFGQGTPARLQEGVAIYVAPSSDLAMALSRELAEQAEGNPAFGHIEVLEAQQEGVRRPVLVAEIEERDTMWAPVYSRARLVVSAAYASDGDVSWRHDKVVVTNQNGPGIWTKIRVELSDTTWGLVSRRGYDGQLGRQAAAEIIKQLATSPAGKTAQGAEVGGGS